MPAYVSAKVRQTQSWPGIWNQEAAEYGESKGLTVVMDRCIKVEHARFNGGPHLLGFNTGQITTRKTIR